MKESKGKNEKRRKKEKSAASFLLARTTLRLEAMRYDENLFGEDDNGVSDRSGWKLIARRDFENRIDTVDISNFVDEVDEMCRKENSDFGGFDKARVCAMLFTNFKCTVDEQMLGFILKSKTEVEAKTSEKTHRKRFFLFRFISFLWRTFKRIYNGLLEMLKIG